jgi:ribosomal protein L24
MTIQAKHKDGTPAREGDTVYVVWNDNRKHLGRILHIHAPRKFTTMKNVELQTYTIKCKDGQNRPAHAWHIKIVYQKAGRR